MQNTKSFKKINLHKHLLMVSNCFLYITFRVDFLIALQDLGLFCSSDNLPNLYVKLRAVNQKNYR